MCEPLSDSAIRVRTDMRALATYSQRQRLGLNYAWVRAWVVAHPEGSVFDLESELDKLEKRR